mgnify:FL=1
MNNIKKLRLRQKLTQQKLAELINVERVTITQWEAGRNFPRAKILPLLAKVLKCTIADLY